MFARPKLALDAVGGDSAPRLADALAQVRFAHVSPTLLYVCGLTTPAGWFMHTQGGRLVVYGCLSGKAPVWPWTQWVFRCVRARR
jgi:trans-2-enoyl-CoA reductase